MRYIKQQPECLKAEGVVGAQMEKNDFLKLLQAPDL